jgi:hypothetical protein
LIGYYCCYKFRLWSIISAVWSVRCIASMYFGKGILESEQADECFNNLLLKNALICLCLICIIKMVIAWVWKCFKGWLDIFLFPFHCMMITVKHHAMKVYWGSGGIAPQIFDLGTRWRWVVTAPSCPRHFTPRERAHGTHLIVCWVGPRARLDVVVKRKIPSPCWDFNPLSFRS